MRDYSIENCPLCEEDVCNGMGSAEMPLATKILNKFPMAKLFNRECNMHDMDFHLQKGFKWSNGMFKTRMHARVRATNFNGGYMRRFMKRRWYYFLVPRIKWFVSGKSGKEAYSKGACKKLVKHDPIK